jgi:hypothetical protein
MGKTAAPYLRTNFFILYVEAKILDLKNLYHFVFSPRCIVLWLFQLCSHSKDAGPIEFIP